MSEPEGAPEWIVTFSDIVSLLVTFFIMILTWSTLEVEDFELIRGSLQGALGVVGLTSDQTALIQRRQLRAERNERQGTDIPADQPRVENPYKDIPIRLRRELGEEVDFSTLRRGYRIRIMADLLFERGSARLTERSKAALRAIAKILAPRDNPIRIEGHTDDRFEPTPTYPTAWHLSAARATAAARYLADSCGIAPERISVGGYADTRPALPNISEQQRRRNRRIDIFILERPSQGR